MILSTTRFCKIAGVLNITPDSFSDGGQCLSPKQAIAFGKQMLADGANILDIGAEASGPCSTPVALKEELNRILEAVQELAPLTTISIDTFKSEVASACLELGAKIINDISALRYDSNMASVIANANAKVILMYSKEPANAPHVSNYEPIYNNVLDDICAFLTQRVDYAISRGIKQSNIILDPGMGRFLSKDTQISWQVLREFKRIVELGFPVMIGTSRKGFLGGKLSERDYASAITALNAATKGASIIRTHNPKLTLETLSIWNKMI